MKLRWATYKKRITAEQVHAYSEQWDLPLLAAKTELERDGTVSQLEFWETYDHFGNGTWKPIPQEVIYT